MDLSSLIQITSTIAMTLDLVDDAFSGPIIESWIKLGGYVGEFRARVSRKTGFEWFQWMAEQRLERERHGSAVPAYVARKN